MVFPLYWIIGIICLSVWPLAKKISKPNSECIVFDHLEKYYPDGVALFKEMKQKHQIELPQGLCANLTNEEFDTMINVALSLDPLWENAIGKDWKKEITYYTLRSLFEKM